MDKEKWETLAKKIKSLDISEFELGVIAGLSSKYDFSEFLRSSSDKKKDQYAQKTA